MSVCANFTRVSIETNNNYTFDKLCRQTTAFAHFYEFLEWRSVSGPVALYRGIKKRPPVRPNVTKLRKTDFTEYVRSV